MFKSIFKSKKTFLTLLIVALLALGLAGYFYYQLSILKQNPQAVAQKETEDLVAKVSALVVLPQNETPTIATVADPEALKNQAFFTDAKKGDKVLIYAQAKKAILYSVSLNKILEIAPLNLGEENTRPSTPAPVSKQETVKTATPKTAATSTKGVEN